MIILIVFPPLRFYNVTTVRNRMLIDKFFRIFESIKIPESIKIHDTHLENLKSIYKNSRNFGDDVKIGDMNLEMKTIKETKDIQRFLTSFTKIYNQKFNMKLPSEFKSFAETKMIELKKIDNITNETDKKFLMDLYFDNEKFYRYIPLDADELAKKITQNIHSFGDSAKFVESHLKSLIERPTKKTAKLKYFLTASVITGISMAAFSQTYSKVMVEMNESAGCIRSSGKNKCKVLMATCQPDIKNNVSKIPICLFHTASITDKTCEEWTTVTDHSVCRMCDTKYDDDPGAFYKCKELATMGDILTEVLVETKDETFSFFDRAFYFLKNIKHYLYYAVICIVGLIFLYLCNKVRNLSQLMRVFV